MLQCPTSVKSRGCTAQEPWSTLLLQKKGFQTWPQPALPPYLLSSSIGQDLALSGQHSPQPGSIALPHQVPYTCPTPQYAQVQLASFLGHSEPVGCSIPAARTRVPIIPLTSLSPMRGSWWVPQPHQTAVMYLEIRNSGTGFPFPKSRQVMVTPAHHGHEHCSHAMGNLNPWHASLCVPLDTPTSQLWCNHPRTCQLLNQTALLGHSLPPLWEAAAGRACAEAALGNERPRHVSRM